MEKQTRLTADIRENFVAYLDGELEESQSKRIDQLLTGNAVARHEVETLSRTWELLDLLPQPKISEDFGSKTLSTIRLDVAPKVLLKPEWVEKLTRGGLWVGWTVATLFCFWLGYAITHRFIPNRYQELLQELPVIQNLDLYSEMGSEDYLKELQASGLFEASEPKKR